MIKICARCGETFEATGHVRNVKYCPDCRYEANLENCRERLRRRVHEHREENRLYYETHRDRFRQYYLTHREQILERNRIKRAEAKALKEAEQ